MKVAASDIGELVLVALATASGAYLAAPLPVLGIPVAAVALGWLAYRRGYAVSVATSLVAAALAAVLARSWDVAAFTGPALLAAGPGAAWALTRWKVTTTVVLLTFALVAAALGSVAVIAAEQRSSLPQLAKSVATEVGAAVILAGKQQGVGDDEAVRTLADAWERGVLFLWPAWFTLAGGLAAALAVPLVSRVGRALSRTVSRMPALADLDLSLHIVWPAIVGLGLLAAATFLRRPNGYLWAIGMNALLIVRAPLFVQGLGDFAALYRKAKVGPLGRAIGFTFLTISEIVIPSVSVVGLFDLFINLRRLPRGGPAGTGGLEGRPGSV